MVDPGGLDANGEGGLTMRRLATVMLAGSLLVGLVGTPRHSDATFRDGLANPASVVSAAVLEPAANPVAANAPGVRANVSWSATASTFAEGYHIYRSQTGGCCHALVGTVTPRETVTFTDNGVSRFETYFYVVRTFAASWTSVPSAEVSVTID